MNFEAADYPDFTDKGPAPCSEYDPDVFFPDQEDINYYHVMKEAKRICVMCPYQIECLEVALKTGDPGIWGGTSQKERQRMKRSGRTRLPISPK